MLSVERLDATRWSDLREVRLAALSDAPQAFWATGMTRVDSPGTTGCASP